MNALAHLGWRGYEPKNSSIGRLGSLDGVGTLGPSCTASNLRPRNQQGTPPATPLVVCLMRRCCATGSAAPMVPKHRHHLGDDQPMAFCGENSPSIIFNLRLQDLFVHLFR